VWSWLVAVVECVTTHYALRITQLWFDWPIYFLKRLWDYWPHVAWDGYLNEEGVHLTRSVPYGAGPAERMHVLQRQLAAVAAAGATGAAGAAGAAARPPVVVYVHGGGFVCTCREMYYCSMCFLARRGCVVYVADYPLAPQERHPLPLLSILRCLAHLKASRGAAAVHLIGDSAGANLALLAAAVAATPSLRAQLVATLLGASGRCSGSGGGGAAAAAASSAAAAAAEVAAMDFPKVHSACSIYGMLDRQSPARTAFPVGAGLQYLWRLHGDELGGGGGGGGGGGEGGGVGGGGGGDGGGGEAVLPVAFGSVLGDPRVQVPPLLLCVGTADPLEPSSHAVFEAMAARAAGSASPPLARGVTAEPVELEVYEGAFHGFFGMPAGWTLLACGGRVSAAPCGERVWEWLLRFCPPDERPLSAMAKQGPRKIAVGWYGVLVISQIAVAIPLAIVLAPFALWQLLAVVFAYAA
jgi:acetyl esterase/lipase